MRNELAGRVALVTGASKLAGLAHHARERNAAIIAEDLEAHLCRGIEHGVKEGILKLSDAVSEWARGTCAELPGKRGEEPGSAVGSSTRPDDWRPKGAQLARQLEEGVPVACEDRGVAHEDLKLPVIIDHMGRPDPARGANDPTLRKIVELLGKGIFWVMLSLVEKISRASPPCGGIARLGAAA